MAGRLSSRAARVRRTVSRATILPLLVRAGVAVALFGALTVAWPVSIVTSRYAGAFVLAALWPAVAPRGRSVTVVAVAVVGGWIADTTWYDSRVALWRVLAIATLLYLGHTLAALAAVLPADAIVNPAVLTGWLTRAGLVVLGSAVLTVVVLSLTAGLAGGAFLVATLVGLAAAVAATVLIARLLRRP
ncbi:hypothetical protein [Actinoplanes sp. RD1]|uniref:hypothetical protein n=1 Tax=Actinoplanes sp. RD1 TaxID=3064538 RepID=UPI002742931A|nr:hypothetical protein [Actinoplanes sp. RD1]